MTDKPSRDDVLKVAKECGFVLVPNSAGNHFVAEISTDKLERFAVAMYTAGAEDMRERAAREGWTFLALAGDADSGDNLRANIHAIPITTNTEGE